MGAWEGGWDREEDVLMKRVGTVKVLMKRVGTVEVMKMFCISTASMSTSCLQFALQFCNMLTAGGN